MTACVAVVGALAHLPSGPAPATVVMSDGRVVAVGERIPELSVAGEGTRFRGAPCALTQAPPGSELTAGLVAVPTQLGLVEVGMEEASRSDDPRTPDPIRAAARVLDGYDPRSTPIAVTRMQGVTDAVAVPGGGWVSGQGGWVHLAGSTQGEAVVAASSVMVASVPTGAFGEGLQELSELLEAARAHARAPGGWDAQRYPAGAGPADLVALGSVVQRRIPLMVGANAAWQLEALARWNQREQVALVVTGGAEAWRVADQLAAARLPVVVNPLVYGPGAFDEVEARADGPALLDRAGVPVILSTFDTHNARTLRVVAGNAVRGGMDHEAALRAITSTPASVFGQPDRGVLRPGAIADVVLWSGDPLEIGTDVLGEWIDGQPVELRSRQTELFERYRTLPGTPAPPLALP